MKQLLLPSEDIAGALCEFAAEERINLLVVGKPTGPGFFNRFVPSIAHRLLHRGRGFDFVIIDTVADSEA